MKENKIPIPIFEGELEEEFDSTVIIFTGTLVKNGVYEVKIIRDGIPETFKTKKLRLEKI